MAIHQSCDILPCLVIYLQRHACRIGHIKAEQFYYYKTTGGAEIDLVFEEQGELVLVEIKATQTIAPKHLRNLRDYLAQAKGKRIRAYLLYLGEKYQTIDNIECIPLCALYRGV